MLVYHGSNLAVEKPKLMDQMRGLDFGAGFYLTTSEEQAKRFSDIVVTRNKTGLPTISVYEFDEKTAKQTLDMVVFPEANKEWLEFICYNRLKLYKGKQHDIVFGPVANDRVYPTIQALMAGQFTIEAAIVALKPFKLFNQYCFATDKALTTLQFVKAMTYGR